jgi:putative SOS response-associated peptidase YedK
MCANYQPVTRMDRMLTFFGVERDRDEVPHDVFPTGLAPFIRRAEDGSGNKLVADGAFGLLPFFAKEIAYGRKTYSARSENVAKLPSFREAWRRGQRCIIPAESIFEPNWETGKAVRWRIGQHGDVPMGIAGVYEKWRSPEGVEMYSFAMLTVNADTHPLMNRFHRPGEEKRMVVILHPTAYDDWLACPIGEAQRFFTQWAGELLAVPDPLLRAPRTISGKVIVPPPRPPETNELF